MFCQNCGNQLGDGARFCSNCGAATGSVPGNSPSQRKEEYVGVVKKCPSCGSPMQSMDAVCTSCGHSFTKGNTCDSVKEFASRLQEISAGTLTEDDKDRGENSRTLILALWFLIALLVMSTASVSSITGGGSYLGLLGVPVLLAVILLVMPPITTQEQQKIDYITAFPIPNDKESIIEFMMLTKSFIKDVLFISLFFSADSKRTKRMNKVWKKKFQQASAKAKMLLKDDPDSMEKIALMEAEIK